MTGPIHENKMVSC